jgi:ribosome modulation factor
MAYVMSDAFKQGVEARRHDVPMDGNPYDEGEGRKHSAWLAGWETEDRFIVKNRSAK